MSHYDELARRAGKKPATKIHGLSAKNFWRTPAEVFDALDAEFHFELDAAADAASALCPLWLGPGHPDPARRDALRTPWPDPGPAFLNPPYSPDGGTIGRWVQRAIQEAGRRKRVVLLLPATPDTDWMLVCSRRALEIRFTPRIAFIDPLGGRTAPMGGSAVVVLGPEPPVGGLAVSFGFAPWKGVGRGR